MRSFNLRFQRVVLWEARYFTTLRITISSQCRGRILAFTHKRRQMRIWNEIPNIHLQSRAFYVEFTPHRASLLGVVEPKRHPAFLRVKRDDCKKQNKNKKRKTIFKPYSKPLCSPVSITSVPAAVQFMLVVQPVAHSRKENNFNKKRI